MFGGIGMLKNTIEEFHNLLWERLENGIYTTEDTIRYTFFHSLYKKLDISPSHIILEYPISSLNREQLDIYIPPTELRDGLVAEFKYHREMPGGKNAPRPLMAGQLFQDIHRLSVFNEHTNINKLFIYIPTTEMANYMKNKNNGLYDFFMLPEGEKLAINYDYISSKSTTFKKSINVNINSVIECKFSKELPNQHYLKIYQVYK